MKDVLERAARVRLVVFDVDGVLTDGSLFFGDDGEEYKAFHARDGQGMAVLREAGVEDIHPAVPAEPPGDGRLLRPLAQQVAETERRAIAAAMASTGGNKLATSRLLGISRATLYERIGSGPKA